MEAYIQDLWHVNGPNGRKVRSSRYGTPSRWLARWSDPDGKRRSKAFRTKDAAAAQLTSVGHDQRTGAYVAPNATTVGDLWPRWVSARAALSRSTREGYSAAWERYLSKRWADEPIQGITRAAVREWLPTLRTKTDRELSASWARQIHIVLSGLLDLAVDDKLLTANPLRGMDRPVQQASERRYLTVAEVDKLLAAMAPHDLEVEVLVMTGIRRGEMAGLRVGDLDAGRSRLRIARDIDAAGDVDPTKTRRHRDVPVGGRLLLRLAERARGKDRSDWLLPAPSGEPWTRDSWRSRWEAGRDKAGLADLDTHELRHTAASLAIHAGANVKTVQRMLGHASAAVTLDIYGHLWDDELDSLPGKIGEFMDAQRRMSAEAERKQGANKIIIRPSDQPQRR